MKPHSPITEIVQGYTLAEQAFESLDEASSKGRTNTPQARSPCLANNSRPHILENASLWLDTNYLDLAENEVWSKEQSCSDDLEFRPTSYHQKQIDQCGNPTGASKQRPARTRRPPDRL
ncbi:hypothetical protein BpHYR1_000328, partial [Brachionus plicatilis]